MLKETALIFLCLIGELKAPELFKMAIDCSSYFVGLDEEVANGEIFRMVPARTPPPYNIWIRNIERKDVWCILDYVVFPSAAKWMEIGLYPDDIVRRSMTSAFGENGGCKPMTVKHKITSFYKVNIKLKEVTTMAFREDQIARWAVHSLFYARGFHATCQMQGYGGYAWHFNESRISYLEEFDHVTFEDLNTYRSSTIFCTMKIFLLLGILADYKNTGPSTIRSIMRELPDKCWHEKSYSRWRIRTDLYQLMDGVIYTMENSEHFQKAPQMIAHYVRKLMDVMAFFLNAEFKNRVTVYHRTKYIHTYQFPDKTIVENFSCNQNFNVTIRKAGFPVSVQCTERIRGAEKHKMFTYFISVGFLSITQSSKHQIDIKITYALHPFHLPGEYTCARYSPGTPVSDRRSIEMCRVTERHPDYIVCHCKSPGFFVLLQDRPTTATSVQRMANSLNTPTTIFFHSLVLTQILLALIIIVMIRVNTKAMAMYTEPIRNLRATKALLEMLIQKLAILWLNILTQVLGITAIDDSFCQNFGILMHAIRIMISMFNIIDAYTVVSVARIPNLRKKLLKVYLFTYALLGVSCVGFYYACMQDYFNASCLPTRMLYTSTIPHILLNVIAAIICLAYWIFRPYHYLDEWFGTFFQTVYCLWVWCPKVIDRPPTEQAAHPEYRLTTLQLFYAVFICVYHCGLKYRVIRFYVRLIIRLACYLRDLNPRYRPRPTIYSAGLANERRSERY
ncbi:unnamed protein product [Calicophoron daubneyi]|uniref:Uncharacterized protein n=1 Tax=Calicophoron daubneyi TaxID=300641 RepID=A0AAV2TJF2_CALDB